MAITGIKTTRKTVCQQLISKLRLQNLSLTPQDIEYFLRVYHAILLRDLISRGKLTMPGFAQIWLEWDEEEGRTKLEKGHRFELYKLKIKPEEGLEQLMRMGSERQMMRLALKIMKEKEDRTRG